MATPPLHMQADEETALLKPSKTRGLSPRNMAGKLGQTLTDNQVMSGIGAAAGFTPQQVAFLVGWLLFTILWIGIGVLAGMLAEGWSPLTSFYVIVQIVTTIGYGDVTVQTEAAKLFMSFYVMVTLFLISSCLTDGVDKMVCMNENFLRSRLRAVEVQAHSHVHDEETAKKQYGQYNEIVAATFVFVMFVVSGTVFFAHYEGCSCSYGVSRIDGCLEEDCHNTGGAVKTYIDSFYMSIITLTTVGFGDHTPRSKTGRLIGCFWMLFGVVATANLISKVAALMDFQKKEEKRIHSVSEDIFRRIDSNNDGVLSMDEFRSFAVLKFGLITEEDMEEIDNIFRAIDKDASGHLSFEEIETHCGK